MSLERVSRHDEALFEFLWCPVCGTEAFTHIPFEGVFCTECNTSVMCRESPESRGYDEAVIITFDATTTWNLHVDEKLRRPLPDDEACVKILGAPGDYHVDWWVPTTTEDWTPVERNEFADDSEPEAVSHLA
ncbi:hypothetical protein [Haloferax sp. Q22]|uniref:DUF7567 family protein n=1 Tax=Haloferax sp. (strain Q22) TaxID=1526048 RepID=UPI000737AE00|nr:hypothetical protein [Haloferax sp. Q22]